MVGLTLSYLDNVVLLDIRADGVGFDVHSPNRSARPAHGNGFGLQTMRQRLRGAGGTLEIESASGQDIVITVSVQRYQRKANSEALRPPLLKPGP